MNRYLIIIILGCNLNIFSVNGMNQHEADSIHYILSNRLYKTEEEKFQLLCNIAENSPDSDTILYYGQLALKLAKKLNISLARSTGIIGHGYLQSGDHANALKSFMKAAALYKQSKNNIGLATMYLYISDTYISQQNNSNAKYYLQKAIRIFEEENDSVRLASAIHNLGYEYYRVEQYDSALVLFSKSKEIYQEIGHEIGSAYCIGNAGLVYSKQKKYEEAEFHLLSAIKTLEGYGDEFAIADFMIEYAHLLHQHGDSKKAIEYATKGYRLASKNNLTELRRDAAFCLAQLYEETRLYDSAYYFQSMYIVFSDSIKNLETIQRMADLRTEYEITQKQNDINILEKEKTIQWIVIGALLLIILMSGGLIYLYYNNLKRNRKLTMILDERRKLLENQSNELKALNHIKDRFFSIISHDLRGPISSLGGISFMIKESLETNNKTLLREISDYIDQTVISLTGLLENLLNWALNQQGQLPFHIEDIETEKLIKEVVKLFTTVSISKHIKIDLKLTKDLIIQGDNNSMMTIIRNLLSNAFKFTETGGKITVSSSVNSDGMAEIMVKDTGIGIPADKIEWLYKFKEDKSTRGTEREKGIGLGLNLVHEFVKINKGEIVVKSSVGKGTSFTLLFPVKNKK